MVDLLNRFDIEGDFWEINTSFVAVKVFKEYRKKDPSRGKAQSSRMMWAICLLEHPRSKFANTSYEDRLELVNGDYLPNNETLDPEGKHEALIKSFNKYAITRTQRIAKQWGDKLDERFDYMDTLNYADGAGEILDKMLASTDKMWKQYQTCLKDLEDENSRSQIQGGAIESLSEQNMI